MRNGQSAPAVLPKEQRKFRYHALVKVSRPQESLYTVLDRVRQCQTPSAIKFKVNVDPYDLF